MSAATACVLSGSILATLSFWSWREAERKRVAASHIEDALTTTPAQLRQLALQRARERLRNGRSRSDGGRWFFEQYVALRGNIASDRPVRYTNGTAGNADPGMKDNKIEVKGGMAGTPSASTIPLAFDAAMYSATLRDRLYECRFEKSAKQAVENGEGSGSGGGVDSDGSSVNARNKKQVAGFKGRVDCQERWRLVRAEREVAPLNTLFMTGSDIKTGSGGSDGGGLRGMFLGSGADTDTGDDHQAQPSQVELVGLSESDLDGAARKIRDEFTPAFHDESKIKTLQNDHRALVVQAAGSNIELAQDDPVRLGSQETVKAVVIGDPVTCVGLSRVDPRTGRMTMSAPNAPSPFGGEVDESDSRPFVLSQMGKMQIGQRLRSDASAHDTAGWVFGVPAGMLLAAGVLFAGKSVFGVSGSGSGGASMPD